MDSDTSNNGPKIVDGHNADDLAEIGRLHMEMKKYEHADHERMADAGVQRAQEVELGKGQSLVVKVVEVGTT